MNEDRIDQTGKPEMSEPEIFVNDYGATQDSTVVVDEADRTVMLTPDETVVIEKGPHYDIAPANRPRKVYTGMWGQTEIATAGLALLAILTTILLYFFLVVPSNSELERAKAERDRLEQELASSRGKYGDITSVEGHVAKLVTSATDFEMRYLPIGATGRTALYQRINSLIAGHGLVNTTGPDFAPLETADQDDDAQSDTERGRSKFRSLFPGVYVTMTLEGTYQGLRRFIRDIETGNEFVVISAVELQPSDSEQKSDGRGEPPVQHSSGVNPIISQGFPGPEQGPIQPAPPARPRGRTHGETVSLRIELAAYFRRPNAFAATEHATQGE
ncbi:MAG: type II secretion system protein M [Acidobacteria bacterium]|nr:type II secretion system protein M [Acidobacteriota bacterium]